MADRIGCPRDDHPRDSQSGWSRTGPFRPGSKRSGDSQSRFRGQRAWDAVCGAKTALSVARHHAPMARCGLGVHGNASRARRCGLRPRSWTRTPRKGSRKRHLGRSTSRCGLRVHIGPGVGRPQPPCRMRGDNEASRDPPSHLRRDPSPPLRRTRPGSVSGALGALVVAWEATRTAAPGSPRRRLGGDTGRRRPGGPRISRAGSYGSSRSSRPGDPSAAGTGPAPGCHTRSRPPRSTRDPVDRRFARSRAARRCRARRPSHRRGPLGGLLGSSCSASGPMRTPSARNTPDRRRNG